MAQWLEARGFERKDQIPRWPCDDELERGLFIFENDDWMVLLYSGMDGAVDEDNRLLTHLGRLNQPLLYVYGQGPAWGYRIHEGREVLDAYASHIRSLAVVWVVEHPFHGDLKFLCDTFDAPVHSRLLEQIRYSRVLGREKVRGRFCEALGVAPAGVGYGEVELRYLDQEVPQALAGWRVRRQYWVKRGFVPGGTSLKLHEIPPRRQSSTRDDPWWPALDEMGACGDGMLGWLRLWAVLGLALRAMAWVFQIMITSAWWVDRFYRLMGWDQRSAHAGEFERELMAGARPPFELRGRILHSAIFGCEMMVPPGSSTLQEPRPGCYALRLARSIGRGKAEIWCDVIRCEADAHVRQMFRYPGHFDVLSDESFVTRADGLPARLVAWRFEPPGGRMAVRVTHGVVQTPGAFVVLSATSIAGVQREREQDEVIQPLRDAMESFRIIGSSALNADTSAAAPGESKA